MKPNTGEYWYTDVSYLDYYDNPVREIVTAQIVNITNEKCLISSVRGKHIINVDRLICKWEPNWFYKMLGYK